MRTTQNCLKLFRVIRQHQTVLSSNHPRPSRRRAPCLPPSSPIAVRIMIGTREIDTDTACRFQSIKMRHHNIQNHQVNLLVLKIASASKPLVALNTLYPALRDCVAQNLARVSHRPRPEQLHSFLLFLHPEGNIECDRPRRVLAALPKSFHHVRAPTPDKLLNLTRRHP